MARPAESMRNICPISCSHNVAATTGRIFASAPSIKGGEPL